MSDYIITQDSVEEVQQDDFSIVYDSSQYHIPSRDTGINYCVIKDSPVGEEDDDNDDEEEEVITFTV
jgi:hypothetical protein